MASVIGWTRFASRMVANFAPLASPSTRMVRSSGNLTWMSSHDFPSARVRWTATRLDLLSAPVALSRTSADSLLCAWYACPSLKSLK